MVLMITSSAEREAGEDADHDDRRRGDDAGAVLEADDDGLAGRRAVDVRLAHPGDEEDLVVHRQPEQDAGEQHRQDEDRPARSRRGRAGRCSQPHWKTATVAPERDAERQQEAERGLERHQDRAEHQHQQQERQPDDDREVEREGVGRALSEMSTPTAVCPVTRASGAGLVGQVGHRVADGRRPGPWSRRRTGRSSGMTVIVANWTASSCCSSAARSRGSSLATGGTTAATSVLDRPSSCDGGVHGGDRVVGALGVDDHDERAVGAGAEVLRDQVVGDARLSLPAGSVPSSGSASCIEATGIDDHRGGDQADDQGRRPGTG